MPTFSNAEWCLCGHGDHSHDLESEDTQPCSAPGCRCQVFRPNGNTPPDMVLLNEHGTGLEDDEVSDNPDEEWEGDEEDGEEETENEEDEEVLEADES